MEGTHRKREIPRIRIDIMFYWMFIVFLCTRLYLFDVQIKSMQDHVNFLNSKMLTELRVTNDILRGPKSEPYELPDTKPDKAK